MPLWTIIALHPHLTISPPHLHTKVIKHNCASSAKDAEQANSKGMIKLLMQAPGKCNFKEDEIVSLAISDNVCKCAVMCVCWLLAEGECVDWRQHRTH